MNIIKHGNLVNTAIPFVCENCGCEFKAMPFECKTVPNLDIFAPHFDTACNCPECNKVVRYE